MLYAADVHINRQIFVCLFLWKPVLCHCELIHITQEVPGRTGPLRHGIGLSLGRAAAVPDTCSLPTQSIAASGDSPVPVGSIALYLRQTQRKLLLRNRYVAAVRAVDDRDRLAPVTLTGEYPVTQLVVDSLTCRCPSPQSYAELLSSARQTPCHSTRRN